MLNGVPYLLACFCKKHASQGPSSIGISASDGEGCSSLFLELHLPSLAKPWRNTRTLMVLRWLQTAGSGQRRVYRKCPGGCSMADHGYSEATAVCCQLWTIGNCVCAQTRVCNESPGRKSWEANGTHAIWCSVPTRAACTGSATKARGDSGPRERTPAPCRRNFLASKGEACRIESRVLQRCTAKVSKIESVIDDEPDTKRLLLWDLLGNAALTIRASSEVVEAWKKAADSAQSF